MAAVFKKEMKQYFNSMVGYIFLAVFLLICGYTFSSGNLFTLSSSMSGFFTSIVNIVMFLIPMLTMRLFAEERKTKTDQLLITLPITLTDIVIGKYCAALCVFLTGIVFTFLYGSVLLFFGGFELWNIAGSYTGLITAASAFISIGLFISAMTENQVIAGVVSYVVLLALWMVGYLGAYYQVTGLPRQIMDWLSLSGRFQEFGVGIFDPSSIVYYVSITAIFLLLTVQLLEKRRWS